MRKNAVIFRFFTWIVLASMLLVNVTPAVSAPLAQDDVQATPTPANTALASEEIVQSTATPTPAPVIPEGATSQNPVSELAISGRVTDASQKPLSGVTVSVDPQHSAVSGADGTYLLTGLVAGRYRVTSSLEGMLMVPYYRVIVLVDQNATGVDFHQRQGGPATRLTPSNPAINQPGPSPVDGKTPGKPWTPPSVERPQPAGGEMQAQAAFSLGQPGLAFRYADTYGTPEAGYNDDPAYLNSPAGIFVDGSGNLLIAESRGKRLLKYDASSTRKWALGKPGVAYYDPIDLTKPLDITAFFNPQDVAVDESGNIWMVEPNHLVEFDSTRTIMHQLPETDPGIAGTANNQFNNPSGIAFGDGLMYVADQGNQRIQVYIFVAGKPVYFRTIGETGVAGNDASHFNGPAKVTFANEAIFVADMNNNRLMKCKLVGGTDFVCSELSLAGPAIDPPYGLNMPTGIAFSSTSLYVTDAGNYRVIKCAWDGTDATGCTDFQGLIGDPGTADDQFLWASDVAVGLSDRVYISDSDNHRVQVFDAAGAPDLTHTIGAKDASGRPAPYPADDTHFNGPAGMVLVYESNLPYLYFTENLGQRLVKLKLNADGVAPTLVWSAGQPGVYGSDDAHLGAFWGGSQGNLDRDSMGRIYVADTANHRVLIYRSNGALWGSIGETGVPGADNAHFNQPAGVSLDNNDNLYVADSGNERIQVFDSNRNYVATLGETGAAGYDAGHFNWPLGVSVDSDGNIFVADTNNQRVQKCTLSGNRGSCLPFAGKTGVSSAGFDYLTAPTAVLYSQGEVYILDAGRNRVLVFDTTGAYRTGLVGDWGARSGAMRGGLGMAVGASGDVYVSDPVNQRIQKYEPSLPATTGTPGWHQANLNGFGRQYAPFVQAVVSFPTGGTAPSFLYASAYNSLTRVAELYRMDSNGNWSLVMNNGFGDPQNQAIGSLFVSGDGLYASTWNAASGGQLFSSTDGTTWTRVELPGLDTWDAEIDVMQDFNGKLYIGSAVYGGGTPPHGARIFACDMSDSPADCSVVFEAPTSSTNAVLSMAVMGKWLYAGMASSSGGQIYRCSNDVCSITGDWQQVFTDGDGSAANSRVSSLAVYPVGGIDQLFAGVANAASGACVFESACGDTGCPDWTQVNPDGFASKENSDINALKVYGDAGKLLAITHNETTGLQIWGYNGTDWGTRPFLPYSGFGNSTNYSIYSPAAVTVFNHMLIVGTQNLRNGGGVWASDPSAYSITGVITGLSQVVYVSLSKNGVALENEAAEYDSASSSYKYAFTGVQPGNYVVTPFSSSFSFLPTSKPVSVPGKVGDGNVSGINFGAAFHPLPLIQPVNGARLDGQTTTLNWANLSVVQYEYQISYTQDTFTPLFKTGKVKTTSVTLTALPFNKTFYWRVRDASSVKAPGAWSTVWSFTTPDPPGMPVLVSPAPAAILPNLSPAFKWNASTNSPDHYRIQVSQSKAFTTLDLDENTLGPVTSYQLESPLTPNHVYYWRVRSVSANGDYSAWSAVWTLTTYPETPWLVFPKDSVVASSLRPTFQWDDSTNTGTYQIQISTFGVTLKTVDVAAKYYTLNTALVPYIQYWWRVRAKGVGGYGAWSNVRLIYAPNPPGSTSQVAPPVNAVVPGYQPVFSWKPVSGALHYNLQIATDATFPFGKLRFDRFVDVTTYDMSAISGDNLNSNGVYYWRVAACNAQYQCSSFTAGSRFFTIPGTPAVKSPEEAAFVNSLGVTFTWDDPVSPASPINSTSFTLEIDKNAGCTGVSKTIPVKGRTFTTPLAGGLFYWHVKATGVGGAAGASAWSDCRSITVEVPPAAPALASPAAGVSVADYRNILFKWTAPSATPDGYEIQVSRDRTFASVDLDNDKIAGKDPDGNLITAWQEEDLKDPYLWGGGVYYWRMRSRNTHGLWGKWTAYRAFTTLSTVYGYVTDVKTLHGVDGVTVEVLQGANNTVVGTDTTAEQGYFIIHNVPKGSTTVRITRDGYITTTQKVNITGPSQNLLNFGFVPTPATNQYSFVLTWPTTSTRSFDMHLWVAPDDPERAHIYPYNVGSITSSPYAYMDAANNPYFTEVITVDRQKLLAAHYRLAVAQVSASTTSPTGSGAKLEIYDDTGHLVSGAEPYIIPKTGFGAWWNILDFTKTDAVPLDLTITPPTVTNKIQNTSPALWTGDQVMFGYVWLKDSSRGFANINVTINGNDVVPNTTAKTDISGLFIVGGLPPGTYRVTPSAPGYDVASKSNSSHSYIDVEISGTPDPDFPYFYSDTFILTPVEGARTGGDHTAVATQGHFTYLASGSSLDIFNIANKTTPAAIKRFQPSTGKINDMVLAGNYAFLASDDGLNIVDISNPAAAYNAGFYLDYGGLTGVAVKGRYAYLLYGWADLIVVDINDFITGVSDPLVRYVSEFHIAGYGERITIEGNYAYIAYGDTGEFRGMYVVNIANPLHPQGIGSVTVSGYPIDVAVSGNYAYLVGGVNYDYINGTYSGGRLNVFDISNPSMPRQLIEMDFDQPVYDVKAMDGYVYLANGDGGMKILDATNPMFGVKLPIMGPGFKSAYPATCIDVLDKYAYVGSKDPTLEDSMLEVFSVANKAAPSRSGSIAPAP
jgi:tripartite motif-containing protein 71